MLALIALAAGAAWIARIDARATAETAFIELPATGSWTGLQTADGAGWRPTFPGAARETFRLYRHEGSVVTAYVATYGRQQLGQKLIGVYSSVVGPQWIEQHQSTLQVPGTDARVTERALADSRGSRRIVWFWYEVERKRLLSPAAVKLHEGLAAFGAGRRSGIVALSAECVPDCASARAALADAYRAGLGGIEIAGAQDEHAL
jgi:EpsI family protein